MPEKAIYTHGHHSSVVNSHARRTAQNSAAFLLPHIKPTDHILDLGCGPGSITIGFAKLVPQGHVTGGDAVSSVLTQAQSLATTNDLTNITFQEMDGNALPFPDNVFDVSFCHQLLQHVGDPASILEEMRRVTKPGGIVAARDADYQSFTLYPQLDDLETWNVLYRRTAKANGAEPNAGRYLQAWAQRAGFGLQDITFSWTSWNYQDEEAVAYGQAWKDRSLHSDFATTAMKNGGVERKELEKISKAWETWSQTEGRFVIIPNGEVICRVT